MKYYANHLIRLECNDEWVEETIIEAIKLLEINDLPSASKKCSTCLYLRDRWKVKQQIDWLKSHSDCGHAKFFDDCVSDLLQWRDKAFDSFS